MLGFNPIGLTALGVVQVNLPKTSDNIGSRIYGINFTRDKWRRLRDEREEKERRRRKKREYEDAQKRQAARDRAAEERLLREIQEDQLLAQQNASIAALTAQLMAEAQQIGTGSRMVNDLMQRQAIAMIAAKAEAERIRAEQDEEQAVLQLLLS